jgi:dimethylargininase
MDVFEFNNALVRAPPRSVVDGLRAVDRGPPNYEGVLKEHAAYVEALESAGIAVEVLSPLERYPDSVFVEDAALVFGGAAIVLRSQAPTRAGEAAELAPILVRRFDRVLRLEQGFVDGGDVLITALGAFIGRSARTDALGAQTLVSLLAEIGVRGFVVTTPEGALHLKSECALLDNETMLATNRLAASGLFDRFRTIVAPDGEEGAANAIRVNDRVLISDAFPRTAEMLAAQGYRTVLLATREIAKIDAGLSCLSLRWRAGGGVYCN